MSYNFVIYQTWNDLNRFADIFYHEPITITNLYDIFRPWL